ncbi:MAG: SH3 domain-containing protein [Pseudomonadota bacterium]
MFRPVITFVIFTAALLAYSASGPGAYGAEAAEVRPPEITPRFDTPSGYPVPRFVSAKKNLIYGRIGPGKQYPVKWELRRRGMPLEVIAETENWRKVRDWQGDEMWVYAPLLDGRRYGVVLPGDEADAPTPLRRFALKDAPVSALLKPGVIVRLEACDGVWCLAEAEGRKGWAPRRAVWGVYANERFDERGFSRVAARMRNRDVDGAGGGL